MGVRAVIKKGSRSASGGPFKYVNYEDNHAIWPGSEAELSRFVHHSFFNGTKRIRHKFRNAHSSHSEDALTWSCFDVLKHLPSVARRRALEDIWVLCFQDPKVPDGLELGTIHVGKRYPDAENVTDEIPTEVDASIESSKTLVFFEAKLYSPMSPADPDNPAGRKDYDQIALKLRVGASEATRPGHDRDFYFILLDIAPMQHLRSIKPWVKLKEAKSLRRATGFSAKWRTAYWFARYKYGRRRSLSPLKTVLAKAPAVTRPSAAQIADNMGWLTWADLYKAILRAVISAYAHGRPPR
jgi:hypothetical protein